MWLVFHLSAQRYTGGAKVVWVPDYFFYEGLGVKSA